MSRLRAWWRRRFGVPPTGVTIMLGKNSRVPLLQATRDDLLTGARINRREALKLGLDDPTVTARKRRRAQREIERARFCEGLAEQVGKKRVRDLPKKRQREIVDRAEVLARPPA